jgi:hypothetical protein
MGNQSGIDSRKYNPVKDVRSDIMAQDTIKIIPHPQLIFDHGMLSVTGSVDVFLNDEQIDRVPVNGKLKNIRNRVNKQIKRIKNKEAHGYGSIKGKNN